MENTIIKDIVLDKKINGYSVNTNDFIASNEITVTITLAEYRELVTKSATSGERIQKAENDRFTREQHIKALEKEVSELKGKLYEMQSCDCKKEEE